ncbi:M48 family metallopeptidase [Sneathiella sp.]|uniref:M48 family metallopeptidase n=1 Tax=Sneathiella sp. TaxID=1964365 RepID=UPI0039E41A62
MCLTAFPSLSALGQDVPLVLRRSARAKRLKIRVEANRSVTVVLPRGISDATALSFVEKEHRWVLAQLAKIDAPVPFSDAEMVPVLGREYILRHCPDRRGVVSIEGREILVCGQRAHMARRFEDWAKRHIRSLILEKVTEYAEKAGVSFGRITVKDQKSRWGSCSSAGNLNFSWRLIFMPEFVVDYIVCHEVCHLVHLNHSRDFWRLNRRLCPDTEKAKAWLKENGSKVHKYGAT